MNGTPRRVRACGMAAAMLLALAPMVRLTLQAQEPGCSSGIVQLPQNVNGRVTLCSAVNARIPALEGKLDSLMLRLAANDRALAELRRLLRSADVVGRSLTTDNQAELINNVVTRLAATERTDHAWLQQTLGTLLDGMEALRDQMALAGGSPTASARINEALAADAGTAIARLDLAEAQKQLADISEQLARVASDVSVIEQRTGTMVARLERSELDPPNFGEAMATADTARLRRIVASRPSKAVIEAALGWRSEPSAPLALDRFLRSTARNAQAVRWLDSLLALGLSPDAEYPTKDYASAALLTHAIWAGNLPAALLLLKRGAWPHPYEALSLTPYRVPLFLHPIEVLATSSVLSQDEKRDLVQALLASGAVVAMPLANESRIPRQREEVSERVGVVVGERASECCSTQSARLCESRPQMRDSGWCDILASMPRVVVRTERGGPIAFSLLQLQYLINIRGDRALFLAAQRNGTPRWGYDQYAVVSVTRDLSSWAIGLFSDHAECGRTGSSRRYCWSSVELTRAGRSDQLMDRWSQRFRMLGCVPLTLDAFPGDTVVPYPGIRRCTSRDTR